MESRATETRHWGGTVPGTDKVLILSLSLSLESRPEGLSRSLRPLQDDFFLSVTVALGPAARITH